MARGGHAPANRALTKRRSRATMEPCGGSCLPEAHSLVQCVSVARFSAVRRSSARLLDETHARGCQGSKSVIPMLVKWRMFRVTRMRPCVLAVAAMKPSITPSWSPLRCD
jgi:hypothetical protein